MKKECTNVWENCLSIIKDNVSKENFETWFKPIKPIKLEHNILTIGVPSLFYYEWLEANYIDLLYKVIKRELGNDCGLEYKVTMDSSKERQNSIKLPTTNTNGKPNPLKYMPILNEAQDANAILNPFVIPGLKKIKVESQLIDNYSFENFIEGDCNRVARSAGNTIAANPGQTSFNPFFIYSNVGLGKTHLMHAIGLKVKKLYPDKTVLYITAEQFLQQFVESFHNKSTNDFIHYYHMIDVLLIDDIQILSGKTQTLECFFQIFNHLHQNHKQIILSSDKSPHQLEGMERRIISRFLWGLSEELAVPDFETKMAIIKRKIYQDGIDIPNEVIKHIAHTVNSNVRELEGALVSLMAKSTFNKQEITVALAKEVVEKYAKNISTEITIDDIIKLVCNQYGVLPEQIKSKSRRREIVQPRQLVMYLAKKHSKLSLSLIGQICGGKNHATVIYASNAVVNQLGIDKVFKETTDSIEKKIKLKKHE